MKPHYELPRKAWSMWQHYIPPKHFRYVLESIQKFIIELHVPQCLFVRGSNKKQKRGRIISNFTKRRDFFHLLWQPSALGVNFTMWAPFLHPSKKALLSPSVWPRGEYTWTINWKQSLLIYFEIGCSLFSRVGIGWWTLL